MILHLETLRNTPSKLNRLANRSVTLYDKIESPKEDIIERVEHLQNIEYGCWKELHSVHYALDKSREQERR